MAKTKTEVRALKSFVAATKEGYPRPIKRGDVVAKSDSVVKGREDLFEQVEVVERATAAPGEKRTTPKRTKDD